LVDLSSGRVVSFFYLVTVQTKYNSSINVLGSIPDYRDMIDYIVQSYLSSDVDACFQFRTAKATTRFRKAIDDGFIQFTSDGHKNLFLQALASPDYSLEEKLIILFWQLAYSNALFSEITDNVYLRALYAGRTSIKSDDVLAYIHHLKTQYPDEFTWSEQTIKITASKYLTMLKKLGLADGKIQKELRSPHISSGLFVYLVKFALLSHPEENTLNNPMFRFSFLEQTSIINRLKAIEYITLWDITQIGSNITITLK
jgi:hypothetical protein